MRSKVKPKPCLPAGRRPARKHNTISYRKWIETVNQANQWHDELRVYKAESFQKDCKIEGQRRALETAEADKRILLDETLKLQSDMRSLAIDRDYWKAEGLKGGEIINEMRTERDALAKRNQELQSDLDETVRLRGLDAIWIKRLENVNRTSCQMGFSDLPVRQVGSKGVKP